MPGLDEDEIHWSDDEHLFDSPSISRDPAKANGANSKPVDGEPTSKARHQESRYDAEEAREKALKQELENVQKINQVIEGVIESLEKAKSNMNTVSNTVSSASSLLQTWTRILSQTEHNQRLIMDPEWRGATADLADMEAEETQRQLAVQRRQLEEEQRREVAARKVEEDERRRAEAAQRGTRGGTRGRVRGTGRAGSSIGSSVSRSGSVSSRTGRGPSGSTSRGASSIGRGLRGSRARGTG